MVGGVVGNKTIAELVTFRPERGWSGSGGALPSRPALRKTLHPSFFSPPPVARCMAKTGRLARVVRTFRGPDNAIPDQSWIVGLTAGGGEIACTLKSRFAQRTKEPHAPAHRRARMPYPAFSQFALAQRATEISTCPPKRPYRLWAFVLPQTLPPPELLKRDSRAGEPVLNGLPEFTCTTGRQNVRDFERGQEALAVKRLLAGRVVRERGQKVAEVLRSGFDKLCRREGWFRRKWFAVALGAALLASSLAGTAQVSTPRDLKKDAASNSKASPAGEPVRPTLAPARAIPAQPALPPIEPVRPPGVAWDGSRLTIDAVNSTLSDVLLAVRSRTGASIEMPVSTSAERVAIHVGPAPIREVLSSLLYGTNFNYVIQASENDKSGLGKLILSSRDGDAGEDLIDTDIQADRNVRLMPGYGAPGKRDFEVAHTRAARAAAENAVPAESANQDSASVANDAGTNDTPPTDPQPIASNGNSTDSPSAQPDAALTPAPGVASTDDTSSTGDDAPTSSTMEQQRRQIQAQQNQPPKTSPIP